MRKLFGSDKIKGVRGNSLNAYRSTQAPTTIDSHQLLSGLSSELPLQMNELPLSGACAVTERRLKPRISVSVSAQVRGYGVRFEAEPNTALLKDLSAGGLRLQLKHQVKTGQRLFILFPIALGVMSDSMVPSALVSPSTPQGRIAVIGVVRRSEAQADASCQVGVEIVRHRFVYGGDN